MRTMKAEVIALAKNILREEAQLPNLDLGKLLNGVSKVEVNSLNNEFFIFWKSRTKHRTLLIEVKRLPKRGIHLSSILSMATLSVFCLNL